MAASVGNSTIEAFEAIRVVKEMAASSDEE